MQKILQCINEYEKRLEDKIITIIENKKIPLTEKNRLMAPLSDQKKIITKTKEELLNIENKTYEAKCEMYKFSKNL